VSVEATKRATARWRGLVLIQNALNNLIHHVDDVACWDSLERPLHDLDAVLVGAGPSLAESIERLRDAAACSFVACVNTALPALRHHGIKVDLCVTLENLDVGTMLDGGGYRYLAAGLASHPHVFRRASFYAVDACPNWIRMADLLGTEPFPTGPSALCFGAMLLRRLGAGTVTLVGADLAVYPGEPMYAQHTGWEMIETERVGDSIRCAGTDERKELHWSHHVPAPPDERPLVQIPGLNGGLVDSLPEFATQAAWLTAHGSGWLHNASTRGAAVGIPNTLPSEPAPLVGLKGAPAPFVAEAVLRDLREQASAMTVFAEAMLARGFADGVPLKPYAPLVDGMCVPDLIAMRDELPHMDRAGGYEATAQIARAAAKRLVQIVGTGEPS